MIPTSCAPICAQDEVARQLSDRDHVRRLLQLDGLLVDKAALVVHDRVRVERAVFHFSGPCDAVVPTTRSVRVPALFWWDREVLRDTLARELEAREPALHFHRRDVATGLALEVQTDRAGR